MLREEAINVGSPILLKVSTLKAQILEDYKSFSTTSNKFNCKTHTTKHMFFTNALKSGREISIAIKTFKWG